MSRNVHITDSIYGGKTMSKKGCLVVAVLLCLCFCTACGGKTGNEDVTPTEKLRAEWHKLVKPVTDEDYLGAVKKSRELHESLFPKGEIAPLGSGKSKEEANGELYAFGDSTAKRLTEIEQHTDLPLTGWTDAEFILSLLEPERVWKERYNGMYDDAVLEKINTRIATVVEGMADPSFYPEVEGLVSLLQERGLPRNDVTEYECYNEKGILSVEVNRTWSWYDWKETDEYSEEDYDYIKSQWPDGDYRYTFSELFYGGQDSSYTIVQYQIYESVGLTFDLTTGEELRLSDLFPAGEDYLSYLNTQIVAQMGQEYDEGSPFSGLRGDETFYLTVGREDSVAICFPGILREIGVFVEVPIPRFEETTEPETTGTE